GGRNGLVQCRHQLRNHAFRGGARPAWRAPGEQLVEPTREVAHDIKTVVRRRPRELVRNVAQAQPWSFVATIRACVPGGNERGPAIRKFLHEMPAQRLELRLEFDFARVRFGAHHSLASTTLPRDSLTRIALASQ